MNTIRSILALVFMFCLVSAQDKTLTVNVKGNEAKQILEKARKVVSKKISVDDVKSFTCNTEESFQGSAFGRTIQGKRKIATDFAAPDKIRQNTVGDYSTNQENSTYVLNGAKFSSKVDVFVNGQLQQNMNFGIDKDSQISKLKSDAFLLLFPITLDASWYVPLEFQYIGQAESKDGKAEVIEAVTPTQVKYRLFFDIDTHLLLMMTENWIEESKPTENKYFFSNYQEKEGLLIATKIITERNGKVAQEKEIKNLKVNPTFKPGLFEVK
jgi:hypothetical protein